MFRALSNSTVPLNFRPALSIADFSEIIRLQLSNAEAYLRPALMRAAAKESLAAAIDDATRALALSPGDTKIRLLIDKLQSEQLAWQQTKDRAAGYLKCCGQSAAARASHYEFPAALPCSRRERDPSGGIKIKGLVRPRPLDDWAFELLIWTHAYRKALRCCLPILQNNCASLKD